ncbi:sensor histidine kinase [Litorivita sp. NS0012-18]|uniref:sensor histidine kinase n=1 Tax=Litorivita sp. NS0012-18 TaxID=3127655 RepID=UPI00310A4B7B
MRVKTTQSLAFRVIMLLSVALLPVGLIAFFQTQNVARQAEELSRSAVLGRTLIAVEPQRALLYRGFAASRVLGEAIKPVMGDRAACSNVATQFLQSHPEFILALFVPVSGISTCNSNALPADLRRSEVTRRMMADPRPRVMSIDRGRVSDRPVIVVVRPVVIDDRYAGFVSLSLPPENIPHHLPGPHSGAQGADTAGGPAPHGAGPVQLISFNQDGELLLTLSNREAARNEMPQGIALSTIAMQGAKTFSALNQDGSERLYSSVAVIPGVSYSFSVWKPEDLLGEGNLIDRAALMFPLIMWLISLLVAYIAVHRLVIRHVHALRLKMRRFAAGSRNFSPDDVRPAPAELLQMEETFNQMAHTIALDEAELENGIREKNVLLKEVHHRVKNNLQLIASIVSMEARKAAHEDTRAALRRVQDRVLGLATVHGNLYRTSRLASVHARTLLNEVINQTLKSALPPSGVSVEIEIDDFALLPDQAVPLSLLVTEALTNAVKYLGKPPDGSAPMIAVRFKRTGERKVDVSIVNSIGTHLAEMPHVATSTGLGGQLIKAFAVQIGAQITTEQTDAQYRLLLALTLADETPQAEEDVQDGFATQPPRAKADG